MKEALSHRGPYTASAPTRLERERASIFYLGQNDDDLENPTWNLIWQRLPRLQNAHASRRFSSVRTCGDVVEGLVGLAYACYTNGVYLPETHFITFGANTTYDRCAQNAYGLLWPIFMGMGLRATFNPGDGNSAACARALREASSLSAHRRNLMRQDDSDGEDTALPKRSPPTRLANDTFSPKLPPPVAQEPTTTTWDENRRIQRQAETAEWRAAAAGASSSKDPPSKTSGIVHVAFDPPLPGVWHPPPLPPPHHLHPYGPGLAWPSTATQQQQQQPPRQQAHRLPLI